jgi:hypothetical protein
MGPYIMDIFSFSSLALLNIMDGTCVGKCPIAMFFLVQMGCNK